MIRHDTVIVEKITQDILNWLDENEIEYHIRSNLVRYKHVFNPRSKREVDSQYRREGTKIIFENEKDKLYFMMAWGEKVKKL